MTVKKENTEKTPEPTLEADAPTQRDEGAEFPHLTAWCKHMNDNPHLMESWERQTDILRHINKLAGHVT
tara:strand:+ start:273 stop:479 length:207 start_codon:yes stop_codon:yes gene_type:complete